LPGVGAFDNGIRNLETRELKDILKEKVLKEKIPVLGICLGMQLMTRCSEEGILPGLGWVDGETVRFRFDKMSNSLKIPHMGWNTVQVMKENVLCRGVDGKTRYYFVHSYHVVLRNEEDVLAKTHYGYDFASSFQKENIMGVQFHPEKSHKFGMKLLKNFMDI
jgi:glutamine amidotransferase